MKKIIFVLITVFNFTSLTLGQAPERMKYQAVIRNTANMELINQTIGIEISILQGSELGTLVYTETFLPTTNSYGIVNLEIGSGATLDDFSTINWESGPYFVKTSIDMTGGVSYILMGTSQLMSVPYALYSKTAGNSISGASGNNGLNAYQIWLNLGNTGTETDFIASLTAPMGIIGSVGPQGSQGFTGSQGSQGLTGSQGLNGAIGILGLQGPQGPQGLSGNDGTDGAPGTQGLQGIPGTLGTVGSQGPQGLTGANGAMGSQGAQGAQGVAGTDGVNGANGIPELDAIPAGTSGQVLITFANGYYGWVNQPTNLNIAGAGITISGITITETRYQVGDFAQGGIVFWVDETGEHGLVCAKFDQSTTSRWYAGTYGVTRAQGDGPYSGEMNTELIIMSQLSIGDDGFDYAAQLCNETQITEAGITYGDWYLPSKDELEIMYQNKSTIATTAVGNGGSGLAPARYWTSTEDSTSPSVWAYSVSFQIISTLAEPKYESNYVRAVRSF